MLYAQIGATDAKLRHDEQGHKDLRFLDLEEKLDLSVRVYCSWIWISPARGSRISGEDTGKKAGEVGAPDPVGSDP